MSKAKFKGRRFVGAVGAAAGGLVAGQAADAEVVFQNVSNHVHPESVDIDLGADGIRDFRLGASIDGTFTVTGIKADTWAGNPYDNPTPPGLAGVILDSNAYAVNLAAGSFIGPTSVYATPLLTRLNGETSSTSFEPAGNFNDVSGFVGVQFELAGNTHYGYMGYMGEGGLGGAGTVTKIGWESTPGLGILAGAESSISANQGLAGDFNQDDSVDAADFVMLRKLNGNSATLNVWNSNFGNTGGGGSVASGVPEPTSLALLAAGAAGVSFYRRRRTEK